MNKILKALLYIILLPIHMFGSLLFTLSGLACIAAGIVYASNSEFVYAFIAIIGSLICLGLQKICIMLDPSWLYYKYDEW